MMWILYCVIVIILLTITYVYWQKKELKKFVVTDYIIKSNKIKEDVNLVVITDMHGFEYGKNNKDLINAIIKCKPDIILVAGDMIVSKYIETYKMSIDFLKQIVKIAPVYYAFGNHESRVNDETNLLYPEFLKYWTEVEKASVKVLNNENKTITIGNNIIAIYGLEIDLFYYYKGKDMKMDLNYIEDCLGKVNEKAFSILLAHNPAYVEQYAMWGSNLTFCGHNHGGLIQIPGIGSIISPQLTFFPKYGEGYYEIGDNKAIVSRGLGTHTFHVRINNRAELINVKLSCNTKERKVK